MLAATAQGAELVRVGADRVPVAAGRCRYPNPDAESDSAAHEHFHQHRMASWASAAYVVATHCGAKSIAGEGRRHAFRLLSARRVVCAASRHQRLASAGWFGYRLASIRLTGCPTRREANVGIPAFGGGAGGLSSRDRGSDAALSYPSGPVDMASARSRAARATGECSK